MDYLIFVLKSVCLTQIFTEMEIEDFADKKGRINENKLFSVLYGKEPLRKVKSVPSSIAQTTTQYASGKVEYGTNSVAVSFKDVLQRDSMELYYLIYLLEATGARISELLNVRVYDISSNGAFVIKGAKGSEDRIINVIEVAEYMRECKKNSVYPFKTFSRFFVYNYLKKLGVGAKFGKSSRMSVTHYFRHNLLLDAHSIDKSSEASKAFIGHKSINSTKIYSHGKKK